jgi:hypothetical protein
MAGQMRIGRHGWVVLLAWLSAPVAARAEEDPIKAQMAAALEAQVDEPPRAPELPTRAAVLSPARGRERAAEVKALAAARWAAKHGGVDAEGPGATAKAARAADRRAVESVSPATRRRAYGKGGRP